MSMQERYKVFYEKYKNKLFSYLVYKSGDSDIAQDIMQESFTRHFKSYGNDVAISPALLYTIARNALTDHHRYQNRFQDNADFVAPDTGNGENAIIVREECKRVTQAMKMLSQTEQEILTLAVGGVAYKEIASIIGASEANIKVKVHRARIKLRQMLNEEEAL